jgi:hypothetical protein
MTIHPVGTISSDSHNSLQVKGLPPPNMVVGEARTPFNHPPITPEALATERVIRMDRNTLYRVECPASPEALIAALAAGTM